MALIFQKPLEMQNNTKKMVVNIVLCVATSTLLNISLADLFGVSIVFFTGWKFMKVLILSQLPHTVGGIASWTVTVLQHYKNQDLIKV